MNEIDLDHIVEGCKKGDLKCQEAFYRHFYGYAMAACLTYTSREDALEVMHDGFLKIFRKIDQHRDPATLKGWIRRVMVNTAIDHYRKNQKHRHHDDIQTAAINPVQSQVLPQLAASEILDLVQQLSPAYRMVFNLYVIEGYSHKEIAKKLGIKESTSRSNLVMANRNLRSWLTEINANEKV